MTQNPSAGGSYIRDPKTGALKRVQDAPPPPIAEQPQQPAADPAPARARNAKSASETKE